MRFCCEDATSLENTSAPWADMDVVFLAALVGMTEEAKMDILEGLKRKLKKGCLVLVRSARGLRKVLYPVRHFPLASPFPRTNESIE